MKDNKTKNYVICKEGTILDNFYFAKHITEKSQFQYKVCSSEYHK